jgi:hypothetical protein
MPISPVVFQGERFEAGTKYPTARVVDKDGAIVSQADFSGMVQRRVYDMSSLTPATAVLSNTVAVANVLFNALQTWDIDSDGYNFRDAVSSNDVAWEGGHVYRLSYLLPHTSQGYIPVVFDMKVIALLSL